MVKSARVFTVLCGLATTAVAVNPIIVDGKDFVDSVTKDRFQIIGVDYQPGGSSGFDGKTDPLSEPEICLRDAALMQRLGVNTVRIYNINPELNHDECMSIFNAAGIYLVLDVNSPLENGALNRKAPWESYNPIYMNRVFGMVEAFKNYPNVLALFAGNEVINEQSVRLVPAYIRAVQRDIKDYIAKHADRPIPVGYSAADVRDILMDTSNYMSCEIKNATSSRSDFFGLNSYSWCGDSSYTKSGYNILTEDFANASFPVFFSEYGCNEVQPRIFTEVQAIYGEDMTQALSGGLVYEYTQEDNDYGLVKVNSDGSVKLLIDYANLQKQFEKLDLNRITSANVTQTSIEPVECTPDLITTKDFLNTFDLPKRLDSIQEMIDNGVDHKSGQIVDVKETKVTQKITDHNGNPVEGVELKILSDGESNLPGASTSGNKSGSGSSNKDTETSAAGATVASGMLSMVGAAVAVALTMVW